MRRQDLQVGMEVAYIRGFNSYERDHPVRAVVVDTRPWRQQSGYRAGYFPTAEGQGVAVAFYRHLGDSPAWYPEVVQLRTLTGPWEREKTLADARLVAARENQARVERDRLARQEIKEARISYIQELAARLGVNLGYISTYDAQLRIDQVFALVEALEARIPDGNPDLLQFS